MTSEDSSHFVLVGSLSLLDLGSQLRHKIVYPNYNISESLGV